VVNIAHNPRNICRSRDRNLWYSSAATPNVLTGGSYESEMYKIWQQSMTEWLKTETRGMLPASWLERPVLAAQSGY
jgi:hypothetical protein